MSWGCWLIAILTAAMWGAIIWSRMETVVARHGGRHAPEASAGAGAPTYETVGAVADDSSFGRIAVRARELAVALEQATRLGGVDLIATYAEPAVAKTLYDGYLERLRQLDEGARLRLKVVQVSGSGDSSTEPVVTTVLYIVSGGDAQDMGRVVSRELWFWAAVRGRCGSCGAPGIGPGDACSYCGAEMLSPMRWVVRRTRQSESRLG